MVKIAQRGEDEERKELRRELTSRQACRRIGKRIEARSGQRIAASGTCSVLEGSPSLAARIANTAPSSDGVLPCDQEN